DLGFACSTCWSYITRLLNTPIIVPWPAIVASSWIDMLAGLSKKYIFRMPPDFWASAGVATTVTASAKAAAFHQRTNCIMCYSPFQQARLDAPVAGEDSTRCRRPG